MSNDDCFIAAARWLRRGFSLLPCQPGSKRIVAGFGPNQNKIADIEDAGKWFLDRNINMAVCRGKGQIILDFDDPVLYMRWVDRHPQIKKTYTEKTPRRGGYHVFVYGDMPEGVRWKTGVECPHFVMSYPSVIDGKQYTEGKGEIITVIDLGIFSDLSEPGQPTPYLQYLRQTTRQEHDGKSLISKIKQSIPVEQVLQELRPDVYNRLHSRGAILSGNCLFHEDHKQHFFIDTSRRYFGCHKPGCKFGDVIDLYALLKGIDNRAAIEELKGRIA